MKIIGFLKSFADGVHDAKSIASYWTFAKLAHLNFVKSLPLRRRLSLLLLLITPQRTFLNLKAHSGDWCRRQ